MTFKTIDGIRYSINSTYAKVLGFAKNGFQEHLLIPAFVENVPVHIIHKSAFAYTGIKSLKIPSTIIYIEHGAFQHCLSLETVEEYLVGETLLQKKFQILDFAFEDCPKLREVWMLRNVSLVANCAFKDCPSLTIMKSRFSKIRKDAFANCTKLTEIKLEQDGYIATGSIENSGIRCVTVGKKCNITQPVKKYIINKQVKLICPEDSNLIELVYIGAQIVIVN